VPERPNAAWFELSSAAAALLIGMLLVMWALRPAAGCALPPEAPRALNLNRDVDREHLTRDLGSADRVARRLTASAGDPQAHSQLVECENALIEEIANRHHVSVDDVRRAAPLAQ
jgi:hypothetical protein